MNFNVSCFIFTSRTFFQSAQKHRGKRELCNVVPEKQSARTLKRKPLSPSMFHSVNWGGYYSLNTFSFSQC